MSCIGRERGVPGISVGRSGRDCGLGLVVLQPGYQSLLVSILGKSSLNEGFLQVLDSLALPVFTTAQEDGGGEPSLQSSGVLGGNRGDGGMEGGDLDLGAQGSG